MPTMTDRYLGIPDRNEILKASVRRLSGEDLRAMKLYHEKCDARQVKFENHTRKVTFGMKVSQNVFLGRLINVEPTAVRRTERAARFIKADPDLGRNTRAVMEYLWERCWEYHTHVHECGLPEKYRPGGKT